MNKQKAPLNFTLKNWQMFGVFLIILGLISIFVMKELKIGLGLFLVGLISILVIFLIKKYKII
jgi:uncharacterized paraquat-inducible protein A